MTAHELASALVEAMNDGETPAWTTETSGLSAKGLKAHRENDDYCVAYVQIGEDTFSMVVQRVDS